MRVRMTVHRAIVFALATASLSGCAIFGKKDDEPAWFTQRVEELEDGKYPKLASVPAVRPSSKTPAQWQATEEEVQRAGDAVWSNPRAAAAAPESAAAAGAFEAQARKEATPARPER